MDTCSTDSDGDGVEDGYEYQSATRPQRRRVPEPEHLPAVPRQAAVREPARQRRREHGPRRRQPHALGGAEAVEVHVRRAGQAPRARRRCTTPTAASTRSTRAVAPTAAASRRWPPRATTSRSTSRTGSRRAGYQFVDAAPGRRDRYEIYDANRDHDVSTSTQPGYLHSERYYLDTSDDGWLSDDERDEDADGLSNYVESHGTTSDASWWALSYTREHPFSPCRLRRHRPRRRRLRRRRVRDGADDQDHDDIPNLMELSRKQATGRPFERSEDQEGRAATRRSPTAGSTRSTRACRIRTRGRARPTSPSGAGPGRRSTGCRTTPRATTRTTWSSN